MAHRTKQDKPCAHTKQKHKHMASKTKSLAMCKTGHGHAANDNTHKPRVHTKHDKQEKAHSRKTSCVQHNKIMKKHAAEPETHAEQNTTPVDRGAQGPSELETARSHSKTEHGAWVSEPRHETKTEPEQDECKDPNTTLQHETKQADERAHGLSTLEAARSQETRQEGSVRVLSQNHE